MVHRLKKMWTDHENDDGEIKTVIMAVVAAMMMSMEMTWVLKLQIRVN